MRAAQAALGLVSAAMTAGDTRVLLICDGLAPLLLASRYERRSILGRTNEVGVLIGAVKEFALAEYHEAANAYFKGVDIGYTTVRAYITMNVLFAALISAVSESQAAIFASGTDVLRVVPILAIVISFTLMFALPYYFRHLENCRRRCEEIEKDNGGQLFTRLGSIAHARNSFNTVIGLVMIIVTVLAFWVYFALRSYNLGVVDILDTTKRFIDSLS